MNDHVVSVRGGRCRTGLGRGLSRRGAMVLAASVGLAIASTAFAQTPQTVTIGATRGNTLFQSDIGEFSGASAQWIFAGLTAGQSARRGILQFDLPSSIPAGSIITGVTLRMRMSRSIVNAEPVTIHTVTNSWTNGTSVMTGNGGAGVPSTNFDVTWRHRQWAAPDLATGQLGGTLWDNAGGDFNPTALATRSVSGIGFYTWTSAALTADVQRWLDNPGENFGWMILGDEAEGTSAKRFDGPGNANAANRPSLAITYIIPTPTAAATIGLLGTLALRRRR